MSAEHPAACPYCGEPKARHEYVSPSSCVLSSTASAAKERLEREWGDRYEQDAKDEASAAHAAQGRRWPRAWRVFLWALAALAFLEAPAHYPNLSFHGFLGALPWPVYVVQGCVWSYLGWSLGRG